MPGVLLELLAPAFMPGVILWAMLTGMVNIAVFAAFRFCRTGVLLSNVEFKPVWRKWQLDIARYGWQKRQETATKWQRMARPMAKTARFGRSCHSVHVTMRSVALGQGGHVWRGMRLFKVLATRGGAA